jgi:hypothetical protein
VCSVNIVGTAFWLRLFDPLFIFLAETKVAFLSNRTLSLPLSIITELLCELHVHILFQGIWPRACVCVCVCVGGGGPVQTHVQAHTHARTDRQNVQFPM